MYRYCSDYYFSYFWKNKWRSVAIDNWLMKPLVLIQQMHRVKFENGMQWLKGARWMVDYLVGCFSRTGRS